jgi:hypothetical protein
LGQNILKSYFKLHHLGYATANINTSLVFFLKLGFNLESKLIYDDLRGINIQFIKIPSSDILVELISPDMEKAENSKESEIHQLLTSLNRMIKTRAGLYHFGFELLSSDFNPKDFGLRKITSRAPAIALNNRGVEFYLQHDGSIVEIIYPEEQV